MGICSSLLVVLFFLFSKLGIVNTVLFLDYNFNLKLLKILKKLQFGVNKHSNNYIHCNTNDNSTCIKPNSTVHF